MGTRPLYRQRHSAVLSGLTVLPRAVRASPVSFFASAGLLQTLREGCLTGVAEGFLGGSAARSGQRKTLNEDRNRSTWSELPLRDGEFARL